MSNPLHNDARAWLQRLLRYWPILPLALIALITRDWAEQREELTPGESPTVDLQELKADYYLEGFNTRRYRSDGSLEYQLQGETLTHFPDGDRAEIVQPRLSLYRQQVNWQVKSPRGEHQTNPERFTLNGGVALDRVGADGTLTALRTESLSLQPDENRLHTADRIAVIGASWQLNAVGMESKLDGGTLSLLSEVRGRFEAPNQILQEER